MKKRPNETWDEFRKRYVIPKLRGASMYWPVSTEVKDKARVERGLYECAACKGHFKNGQFELDHIIPVVSTLKGFTNWEDYITRLFVTPEQMQVLCISCHDAKTSAENYTREAIKSKQRELDKKIKKEAKQLAKKK